jgi:cytoskeletal protein CcmA (bactofilin family)
MSMYTSAASGPRGGRESFIDSQSHFSGTHSTPNDFRVEGHFDGTIECAGALFVAESADVNARVTAGSISVAGHLQGEMLCRGRFEILSSGKVEARVQAGTIVVHDGARYQGEMRMRAEGSFDLGAESTASKRSEPRQSRRAPPIGGAEVPTFGAAGSRGNGRSVEEGADQRPNTERGQSGQAINSED